METPEQLRKSHQGNLVTNLLKDNNLNTQELQSFFDTYNVD